MTKQGTAKKGRLHSCDSIAAPLHSLYVSRFVALLYSIASHCNSSDILLHPLPLAGSFYYGQLWCFRDVQRETKLNPTGFADFSVTLTRGGLVFVFRADNKPIQQLPAPAIIAATIASIKYYYIAIVVCAPHSIIHSPVLLLLRVSLHRHAFSPTSLLLLLVNCIRSKMVVVGHCTHRDYSLHR